MAGLRGGITAGALIGGYETLACNGHRGRCALLKTVERERPAANRADPTLQPQKNRQSRPESITTAAQDHQHLAPAAALRSEESGRQRQTEESGRQRHAARETTHRHTTRRYPLISLTPSLSALVLVPLLLASGVVVQPLLLILLLPLLFKPSHQPTQPVLEVWRWEVGR